MNKWMPKNSKPDTAGWFYVRNVFKCSNKSKVGMRYFDDSNSSWYAPNVSGILPNDSFSEWLLVPGLEQKS